MWTGEKIIFVEKSVIVPFFKEMGPDTIRFAQHEYFLYTTCKSQACLVVGTLRIRDT